MQSLTLRNFWNWLPTFRVVAERESIQDASRVLHVSPSAVSRTIRLLEEQVGRALFLRECGHVRITPAGSELLEAVRRSMRLLDEGVNALRSADERAPFRLSLGRDLALRLGVAAVRSFQTRLPERVVQLLHGRCSEASARLLDGSIDVAVLSRPSPLETGKLELHRLGTLEVSVYCGASHPLHGVRGTGVELLLEHRFIHCSDDTSDLTSSWPPELRQRVGLELADAGGTIEACAAGLGLGIIPRCLAEPHEEAGRLWRLPGPPLSPVALYAARRPTLVAEDAAAVMLGCLAKESASLLDKPPAPRRRAATLARA